MNTKDITQGQLETLVLIRSLEEFITDEHENLETLSDVIWTLEESLSDQDHRGLVTDICKLTETGYLVSDADKDDIELDRIPEVKSITPKGAAILKEFEQDLQQKVTSGTKVVLFENFSLFNVDVNLLSGIEFGSLFKKLGGMIKR